MAKKNKQCSTALLAGWIIAGLLVLIVPGPAAAQNAAGSVPSADRGPAGEQVVDRVVAVVNGDVITLFDLNFRLKPIMAQMQGKKLNDKERRRLQQMRGQVLDQMIADLLIEDEAEQLGIEVTDQEIKEQVDQFKESRGLTDEQFQQQLELEGVTLKEFKEKMRRDILKHRLLSYMVKSKVVVTEEEIEQNYQNRTKAPGQAREVRVRLLLFPPNDSGDDVLRRIRSGDVTFAEAVQQHSVGPGSDQGGDLGFLSWKDLANTWRDVLVDMKPGEVSEVFNIQGQNALLQLVEVKKGEKPDLADVREKIYEELYNKKLDALFQEYLQKLREKAVIERKEF
jgi:peptidyl-prolyl cis-trans isomerase SurA